MYVFISANFYQIKVDNLAHQHSCTYKETLVPKTKNIFIGMLT